MSQLTRKEVLNNVRRRYARAGKAYKSRLLSEVVELLGYHRKAAIRALQARPPQTVSAPAILGRPKEYHLSLSRIGGQCWVEEHGMFS
jgi:hypothetical protein